MKISIVIVNYNVKYILEQCLHSVHAAIKNIQAEVFVVDNSSVDGSCAMIEEKFPWVTLIANKDNVGFSRANNQAIRISKGEYVLLLNPDTLVEEDTFTQVCDFMDQNPDGGGLGVKMIDGKGNFLPESKRGLPTLKVSVHKMFGLQKFFPKSKRFNYYYLGHLDNESIHEIEILSGAFMLLRKSVLDEIGLLDEEYFMYGEDIDLSYRIIKAGYKNYYYPNTTIIHYKGESTKKASFKYVLIFYKAMEIFARKQLGMKKFSFYSLFIHTAIWLRALLALFTRVIKKVLFPTFDIALIIGGFMGTAYFWGKHHFEGGGEYPSEFFLYIAPTFALIWSVSIYLSSGYERPVKLQNLFKGIGVGLVCILVVYSLFPESMRYSRVLILLTFIWSLIILPALRFLFHVAKVSNLRILVENEKQVLLIGDESETQRVNSFLKQTSVQANIVGYVSLDEQVKSEGYIGSINQLNEIVQQFKINEIIFCLKDVGAAQIIENMLRYSALQVDFKIAPPESFSVIGSNSSNTTGELYTVELNSIAKGLNKKKKRIFDFGLSVMLLLTSVLWIWFSKSIKSSFTNIFQVLFGSKTWIGYNAKLNNKEILNSLPKLKPSVFFPGFSKKNQLQDTYLEQAHIAYAKDYKVRNDIKILFKNIFNM